jgi:hypothetical protein
MHTSQKQVQHTPKLPRRSLHEDICADQEACDRCMSSFLGRLHAFEIDSGPAMLTTITFLGGR